MKLFLIAGVCLVIITGCSKSDKPTWANTKPETTQKKITEYPDIPPEYIQAKEFYDRLTHPPIVSQDQVLFNIPNVAMSYSFSDDAKKFIVESEIKAKCELTLRRNNVPINEDSHFILALSIEGIVTDDGVEFSYNTRLELIESMFIIRQRDVKMKMLPTWSAGYQSLAGKNKAMQQILNNVEKLSEQFANDYLSANPKK